MTFSIIVSLIYVSNLSKYETYKGVALITYLQSEEDVTFWEIAIHNMTIKKR